MSMWDYEINNNVRSGVTADGIRRLISNGTLKSWSNIQQVGSDNWTTVEQSEFAVLLPGTPAAQLAGLASAGPPSGGRALFYVAIGFAVVVIIGFLMSLTSRHATSLGEAVVENTSVLHDIDVLLVCAVVAILVSAHAIVAQLRSSDEFARASEALKVQELQAIRRAIENKILTPISS